MIAKKCINYEAVLTVFSTLNIATDVAILCLPLPLVWKLQISRRQRFQIIGIFLLGGLYDKPIFAMVQLTIDSICAVSIIRIFAVTSTSLDDPSWSNVYGTVWSVVEIDIGIVCACLPMLGPLCIWMFEKHRLSNSKYTDPRTEDSIRLVERNRLDRSGTGSESGIVPSSFIDVSSGESGSKEAIEGGLIQVHEITKNESV